MPAIFPSLQRMRTRSSFLYLMPPWVAQRVTSSTATRSSSAVVLRTSMSSDAKNPVKLVNAVTRCGFRGNAGMVEQFRIACDGPGCIVSHEFEHAVEFQFRHQCVESKHQCPVRFNRHRFSLSLWVIARAGSSDRCPDGSAAPGTQRRDRPSVDVGDAVVPRQFGRDESAASTLHHL